MRPRQAQRELDRAEGLRLVRALVPEWAPDRAVEEQEALEEELARGPFLAVRYPPMFERLGA
jgi:hypothetical protein